MTTWQRGREIVTAERARREGSLREFVDELRSGKTLVRRVPGTAVFLNRGKQTAPLALRANVEHNHVRHEQVVIMSIETEPVPRVAGRSSGPSVDDLGYADDGIVHVTARLRLHGDTGRARRAEDARTRQTEGELQLDQASYFLSKIELRRGKTPTMAPWRKRLFIATSYITADAAEHSRPAPRPDRHHGLAYRGVAHPPHERARPGMSTKDELAAAVAEDRHRRRTRHAVSALQQRGGGLYREHKPRTADSTVGNGEAH